VGIMGGGGGRGGIEVRYVILQSVCRFT
jgi:hypothetical protein